MNNRCFKCGKKMYSMAGGAIPCPDCIEVERVRESNTDNAVLKQIRDILLRIEERVKNLDRE